MKKKIRVTLLGTNGWYDSETGNTISILIDCPDFYIVLDAGNGLQKLDWYINDEKPVYLFLSHFHLDHICGLHILNKFSFSRGLYILGQKGTEKILNTFVNEPFTMPLSKLPFNINFIEVPDHIKDLPFYANVLNMKHSTSTLGIRIVVENRIIAYCPDTGYCDNAVQIAENADLLLAECAYRPGQIDEKWPHLNPESAARIAVESNAKKINTCSL